MFEDCIAFEGKGLNDWILPNLLFAKNALYNCNFRVNWNQIDYANVNDIEFIYGPTKKF